MNRKHLFIALGILVIFLVTACAQPEISRYERANPTGPAQTGPTADQILDNMKSRLNLTEEQEAQIRPIIEDDITRRQEIMQKYRTKGPQGMKSMMKEMERIQVNTISQVAEFLTDEQLEEYRIMLEEQQQQRENMRAKMGGKRPMGW